MALFPITCSSAITAIHPHVFALITYFVEPNRIMPLIENGRVVVDRHVVMLTGHGKTLTAFAVAQIIPTLANLIM